MIFQFRRIRLHFRSCGELQFAPFMAGNTVRGAFGAIFRKLACVPECTGARTCPRRNECAYARVFEPGAQHGQGPSGFRDRPRPFVFRAAHLGGSAIRRDELFHFDAHLFDLRDDLLPWFVRTFEQLAREGLGPGRVRAELVGVDELPSPAIDLSQTAEARFASIRFVTPTELKSGERLASRPEFAVLFARLRDRIGALSAFYGGGPLETDFHGLDERASRVALAACAIEQVRPERRSSRTGQTHSIGGFVGSAEYEGLLDEFTPFLRAGEITGLGRHTVWGNGEIAIHFRA